MKIGLIADTHGLLRPQALAALQGVDHLIHAGDIGGLQILDELERIAGGIDARDAATAARTSEDEAGPDPDADSPDA